MGTSPFIRAYGLHWYREEVDWKTNGELLGHIGVRSDSLRLVNFWNQTGIYVLHDEYGAYYVGQVERQTLGKRLLDHTNDIHRNKWDRFSWFGFNAVLKRRDRHGVLSVKEARPAALLSDVNKTINDVEALLIMALGTHRSGNKRTEKFTDAEQWDQVLWHEDEKLRDIAKGQV